MRVRLLEICQIAGVWYPRGSIIDVPDDWVGPHRPRRISHDRIDYSIDPAIDANRDLGKLVDEPCYEVLPEPKPVEEKAGESDEAHEPAGGEDWRDVVRSGHVETTVVEEK